mgnify:CR=1 FL=1
MSFATAVRNLFMPDYDTLAARIAAVEARPAMSDADRALLVKAAALVAEIEAAAGGAVTPADPPADDGSITVTDVTP